MYTIFLQSIGKQCQRHCMTISVWNENLCGLLKHTLSIKKSLCYDFQYSWSKDMNMCVNVSPSSYARLRMIILCIMTRLFEFAKKGVRKWIFCVCDCGKPWRQNQSYGNVWLALVRCFLILLIGDLVLRNKVILSF